MRAAGSEFTGRKRLVGTRKCADVTTALLCLVFSIPQYFQVLVRPALRKITTVAVVAGLVFAPLPPAFAFGSHESTTHAALAEQDAVDHGHSHDEDEPHGPSANHSHGHDPADHSHQYAFLSGGSSQWGLPPPLRWPSALSGRPDAAISFGIERPPKRAMSL